MISFRPSSIGPHSVYAVAEARFDHPRDRLTIGQGKRAGKVRRPLSAREFEQCEGIALRLVYDPVDHVDIERNVRLAGEQRPGVVLVYSVKAQARKTLERVAGSDVAPGEQHRDRLPVDSPGREREGPRRGLIEPLRVVEHAQQRTFVRDI